MSFSIIVVILVIGFLYTRHHPPSRFRQKRETGWNSYLHIAYWGFVFAILGAVVTAVLMVSLDILSWIFDFFPYLLGSDYRTPLWGRELAFAPLLGKLAWGTLFALLTGAALAYGVAMSKAEELSNNIDAQMLEYAKLAQSDGMEQLLFESMKEKFLVLITLKSRKVYVGKVEQPRLLHGDLENIVIIPMLSGYRDKDTLKFVVQHKYSDFYEKNSITEESEGLQLRHFKTVILAREIDSASLFDLKTYVQFSLLSDTKADDASSITT